MEALVVDEVVDDADLTRQSHDVFGIVFQAIGHGGDGIALAHGHGREVAVIRGHVRWW